MDELSVFEPMLALREELWDEFFAVTVGEADEPAVEMALAALHERALKASEPARRALVESPQTDALLAQILDAAAAPMPELAEDAFTAVSEEEAVPADESSGEADAAKDPEESTLGSVFRALFRQKGPEAETPSSDE